MKTYRIKYVDAFTKQLFAGNPAGVVIDANGLTDAQMQSIAREMNLSETAFILQPTVKDANLQIRWFTVKEEVPLCGHATIASFHVLAEEGLEGMIPTDSTTFDYKQRAAYLLFAWRRISMKQQ